MSVTVTWAVAIAGFVTYLRASGSPSGTIETRRAHLRRVSAALGGDPWHVDPDRLLRWFGQQDWAPETRRSYRGTLRAFYRWGVEVGHTTENVALRLPVVKPTPPRPRPVPDSPYVDALRAASPRVRLMLRLAAECGLRRAEVARVHSRHLIEDLGGWSLVVLGKGNRERIVPLPHDLARELRNLPPGWAFPGDDCGHLSPRWVGTLVSRALPGDWTMHKLRHRAATRWYSIDRDVFTVQDLLGHASPATTRAYVAIPNDALRRTVEAAAA